MTVLISRDFFRLHNVLFMINELWWLHSSRFCNTDLWNWANIMQVFRSHRCLIPCPLCLEVKVVTGVLSPSPVLHEAEEATSIFPLSILPWGWSSHGGFVPITSLRLESCPSAYYALRLKESVVICPPDASGKRLKESGFVRIIWILSCFYHWS